MPSFPRSKSVAIANGASLSTGVAVGAGVPMAVLMPEAFTGTTLTFQGSHNGVNYFNVFDGGVEVSVTVAVSQAIPLPASSLAAFTYIKIRSGTAGSPSNQAADRTLTLIDRVDL
jgi:hypothetical protein